MKPRTFFGFALLLPYALWCLLALTALAFSGRDVSETWNTLLIPIMFYTIGVILWFVPYTLLAIGMWMWSKGKSTGALRKSALLAPILFAVFMSIEALLVSLPMNSAESTDGLLGQLAVVGGFSLAFGYLCVGIGMGVYKVLQAKKRIMEDALV